MLEGIFDFVKKMIADNLVLVFLFSEILIRPFSNSSCKKLSHICENYN